MSSPPFRTTDFYLACYLAYMRIPVRRVELIGPSRVAFYYEGLSEQLLLDYYNHQPLAAPVAFLDVVEAIKHTRELLHQTLEQRGR